MLSNTSTCRSLRLLDQFKFMVNKYSTVEDAHTSLNLYSKFVFPFTQDVGWHSYCAKDGSPLEWSLAFQKEKTRVRLVFEPQPLRPTIESVREVSLEYINLLKQNCVYIDNLQRILPLILPDRLEGPGGLWFGIDFQEQPLFKVYGSLLAQNTTIQPFKLAHLILETFGLSTCSLNLQNLLQEWQVDYVAEAVSMDLVHSKARIKIYIRLLSLSKEQCKQVAIQCNVLSEYEVCSTFLFAHNEGYNGVEKLTKGVLLCVSFEEENDAPIGYKIHWPLSEYMKDDAILSHLATYIPNAESYNSVIEYIRSGGVGKEAVQAYFSLARKANITEPTVYLCPQTPSILVNE